MAKPDQASLPYCPDCGATRLSGAKFCPHCGCAFTGAVRAKGQPPAVAPSTRPMIPAASATQTGARAAAAGAALDIELLEGVKPFLTGNIVNVRPHTAPGADVDEPAVLCAREGAAGSAKSSAIGRGVTMLAAPLISDASRPDEPPCAAGGRVSFPVAPMRLHIVTQAMSLVDDAASLGPPALAAPAPQAGRRASPPGPPSSGAAARDGVDISAIESQWAARLTSQGGLVDDAVALASRGKTSFALGLGVTHLMAVHAGSALVDDPAGLAGLAGDTTQPTHITRAIMNGTHSAFGRTDDVDMLALSAPSAAQASAPAVAVPAITEGVSLAKDWLDAAEKIIPRKDDYVDVGLAAAPRGMFFAPDVAAIPLPPAPEPEVAYVPAAALDVAPAEPSPPAPWVRFSTPPRGLPAQSTPESKKPGSATMMMSLSATELRALAEQLVQKGALSSDDVDAAKNKK